MSNCFLAWDISRKLFLTAILAFVGKETASRISVGLIVSLIALLLHVMVQPYVNPFAQTFQTMCLFAIVLLYYGGLMLSVTSIKQGYNDAIVGYMVAVVVIIFATLAVMIIVQIISTTFYLRKRNQRTKQISPSESGDTPLEDLS